MATHSCTLAQKIPWTEEPGAGYCPWGHKESDTTERLHFHFLSYNREGDSLFNTFKELCSNFKWIINFEKGIQKRTVAVVRGLTMPFGKKKKKNLIGKIGENRHFEVCHMKGRGSFSCVNPPRSTRNTSWLFRHR